MTKNKRKIPLIGENIFSSPLTWPPTKENDPPRSLRGLSKIVNNDLCHRCGSCTGICPSAVLESDDNGYPRVKNLSACTDCNLCVKVCPGDSFFKEEHEKKLFSSKIDIKDIHGHFKKAYLGYATNKDLRENSSSGGVISALLIYLIEEKKIDGALVVVDSKENEKWKAISKIARTREEILKSTKSKYSIVPTNVLLSQIKKEKGRYAVVGLPCQIQGVRKAMDLDKKLKENIVLTIGLFCHATIENEPWDYVWENIKEDKNNIKRFISRKGKHPGTPYIELKNKELKPVYFPNQKGYRPSSTEMLNMFYLAYTPKRCFTCYDALAEYADIAVGDPWMKEPKGFNFKDGYSFTLARTKIGLQYLEDKNLFNHLILKEITKEQAKTSNIVMGREKKIRALLSIKNKLKKAEPTPDYGLNLSASLSKKEQIKGTIKQITHIFCFIEKDKSFLLKILFSKLGYLLLFINNKRKHFQKEIFSK